MTSIINEVCRDLDIDPEDFFGNCRVKRVVAARVLAIARLRAADFSHAAIARMMRREYSAIQYWIHPRYRERRVPYYAALHAKRRAEGISA